jgi:hypothetical protein
MRKELGKALEGAPRYKKARGVTIVAGAGYEEIALVGRLGCPLTSGRKRYHFPQYSLLEQ